MGRATGVGRLVVTLVVGLVAAACTGQVTPLASPEPTAAAGASLEASSAPVASNIPGTTQSAEPTTVPSPTPGPGCGSPIPYTGPWTVAALLPGSAIEVTVAELNLRDGPCTASTRLETLKKGDILIVSAAAYGPIKADGYPWYSVTKLEVAGPDGGLPPLPTSPITMSRHIYASWIAANDGSTPYVKPLPARCPTMLNVRYVAGMLPAERLACLEGSFVLKGTFGCGGCGGAGGATTTPAWLATSFETNNLRPRWGTGVAVISIYFRPSGPAAPPEGSIIRATVHVDDRAALKCTAVWEFEQPRFVVPDRIAIPYCRERLVVESYEILGTDPDFSN